MTPQDPPRRLGGWNEGESDELDDEVVEGSVVEFAFGPVPNSYFATSYPYRAEYARKDDIRIFQEMLLPTYVVKTMHKLKPRYVMNLAIEGPDRYFMYYYQGRRFAYDSKWDPRKPNRADGPIGIQMEKFKEEERDQISYCSFGPTPEIFFLRSTDARRKWHSRLSKDVCYDLWEDFQALSDIEQVRAATFGAKGWILYGKEAFKWSKHGLPKSLVRALERGQEEGWTINKAVLNRKNHREYVLVYDDGPVYYSFHPDFEEKFKQVIRQWSEEKSTCPAYHGHRMSYPNQNQWDNPEDSGSDLEEETKIGKQRQQQRRRHRSSTSQTPQILSPSQSNTSNNSHQQQEQSDSSNGYLQDLDDFHVVSDFSQREASDARKISPARTPPVKRPPTRPRINDHANSSLAEEEGIVGLEPSAQPGLQNDKAEHKGRHKDRWYSKIYRSS